MWWNFQPSDLFRGSRRVSQLRICVTIGSVDPFVPLIAMHKYIGKWSTFLFYSGSILIRTKGSSTKLIDNTGESTLLCNISLISSWATYYWWEEDVNVDIVDGQPIATAWDRWNVAEPEMGVEGEGWRVEVDILIFATGEELILWWHLSLPESHMSG